MMNEREQQLKKEFYALLVKYDAELEIVMDDRGYPEGINFWSYRQWNDEGNLKRDGIDLTLRGVHFFGSDDDGIY